MKKFLSRLVDGLSVAPQYCVPQRLLTYLVYRLSHVETRWIKHVLITRFIRAFAVDMSQALESDARNYRSFNAFFTRPLAPGARPIADAPGNIVCPVDGSVSQIGDIRRDTLLQAKGKTYTLKQLLVDEEVARLFTNGRFATLYLSPKDYHRVHMPLTGALRRTLYVPDRLFSVATNSVRVIDAVFARNERLICIFQTAVGPMAIVMIGAMLVSGIETVWGGRIPPCRRQCAEDKTFGDDALTLRQGKEMGRFNMGSTVILLFPENAVRWLPDLLPGGALIMGGKLGVIKSGG